MLVKLMAGFDEVVADEHPFVPRASRSRRLALSSLGALLDVEGNWDQLPKMSASHSGGTSRRSAAITTCASSIAGSCAFRTRAPR